MAHRNRMILAVLTLSACNMPATNQADAADDNVAAAIATNADTPSAPMDEAPRPAVTAPEAPAPGTPGGLLDDRTPLEEPSGPIDPKSAEAAGQVVQRYGALLEQRQFADARKLWGDGGKASNLTEAQFVAAYDRYAAIHSEVGKPADTEGAAGSIYTTVPFHLYGRLKSGGAFNLVGPLTLRRVNDVEGATEAQLRWHIALSDLKPRP